VNQHKLFPALLVLMSGYFLSCQQSKKGQTPPSNNPGQQQTMVVQTLIAQPTKLSSDVEVPGSILAFEETEIHPEISGRIVRLNLPEGGNVAKGTLLAKLYDGDLQARMRKLEVQLKIADQTEKRQAELLKIQGISQQDYDLSLLSVQNLKADMDIVKEDIRKTEIRAPFTGKLGLKNVSPGAYVTPASVLTSISQIGQLKLEFNVPERYSNQLKKGMTIQFHVEGSSELHTATLLATQSSIEENTRSLTARALVKNSKHPITPGSFAKVKLVLGESSDALMVPNSAIVPQGRKKLLYVYNSGKANPVEVVTGVRDSTNVQIVEGVKAGDTVITSGILFLRPGMEVKAQ
jgi:membrane fusion protein (multidrug efflux system)